MGILHSSNVLTGNTFRHICSNISPFYSAIKKREEIYHEFINILVAHGFLSDILSPIFPGDIVSPSISFKQFLDLFFSLSSIICNITFRIPKQPGKSQKSRFLNDKQQFAISCALIPAAHNAATIAPMKFCPILLLIYAFFCLSHAAF